ncbi:hypothetical protein BDV28DRAFT_89180 [Aspergillus coremiiformis]|uniref:WSC domain-containing protein n=1 Tax=Aspergillus coremiiformis TaxID=138285 RepID=A0A5N6Z9C8_9EURO|nr:hypothetical protein BDV28DRAFT_89180 [Aspergillus coremiiformis]
MTRGIIHLSFLSFLSLSLAIGLSDISCYNDLGHLAASQSSQYQSVALCEQTCSRDKKLIWATQGEQCYCGDELPPAEAQISHRACSTRCPGYPGEYCGGPNAWTVSQTQPRDVDLNNGIVTAPDDDGTEDPLATLSVNPTLTATATDTRLPRTTVPSSILGASSAAASTNHPDTLASPSSSLATSTATAKVSPSAKASSSPSATPTSAAGRPVLAVSLVGAALVPAFVNWL